MYVLLSILITTLLFMLVNSDEIHSHFFKIVLSNDSDKLTQLLNTNSQNNDENKINVNYIGPDTFTALMIAAQQKNTEIIDILIKNGADVNHAESDGWTALFFSCIFNDNTSIKLLLRSGANSLYESPKGLTALKLCSKNKEISMLIEESNKKLLFDNLNRLNNLLDASTRGDLDEIIKIIKTGYDINSSADNGWTALMHAISNDNDLLVPVLIDAGAKVNIYNSEGWSPLMYATKQGKKEIVEILLANGGEPLGKSTGKIKSRMNALEISEVRRLTDIMKLFFQHIQASRPVDAYEEPIKSEENVIENEGNIVLVEEKNTNEVQIEIESTNKNNIKVESENIIIEKIVPKEEEIQIKSQSHQNQKIKEVNLPTTKSFFARIGGLFGF